MKNSKDNLYIIIPAYNEEENIEEVVKDWIGVVDKIGNSSKLVIVNDGSKDNTEKKLLSLKKKHANLEVITKENSGHGGTVLFGYNYVLKKNANYIFQTDSDGQTIADEFWPFWEQRKDYAVIIGSRKNREDGASRVFVTKVLKFILFLIFHVKVEDANTPFRLMSKKVLKKYIKSVPDNFNLSNVLLSVLFVYNKEKIKFIPITFRPRQGGVNSINMKKISKIGIQAVKDFRKIKKIIKKEKKNEK